MGSEEVWPDPAGVDVGMERSVHTVAVVRTRPRLGRVREDHLHLPAEGLPAVHVPGVLLLREEVLLEEDLVSAAPAGAALTGGPGTSVETATEAVLSIVTLVVVGEVLGLVDVPADDLALRPGHDPLVPVEEPVVPVALLVYLDVTTSSLGSRFGGRCRRCTLGSGWYQGFP